MLQTKTTQASIAAPYSYKPTEERILSVYPTSKGFAFLVIESDLNIVNWGSICYKSEKALEKKFLFLLDRFLIERVVCEKFTASPQRKFRAINRVMTFKSLARQRKLSIQTIGKQDVDLVFGGSGAYTKDSRAVVVASILKPLQNLLPPKRKLWEPDHHRMPIFCCAVLVLSYLHLNNQDTTIEF